MLEELQVGDLVYAYSVSLNEVIEGKVEGFHDVRNRIKILQAVSDGYLRHIISRAYVFLTYEEANSAKLEYLNLMNASHIDYKTGMVVHLKQNNALVVDEEGYPYNYQITRVHHQESKVSLVTAYGEPIGKYDYKDIVYFSSEPLFKSTDYQVGQRVSWVEGDDIYEGTIIRLKSSSAEVSDIKKLLPIDFKKFVPYYKIPSDLHSDNTSKILTTLIGDDLD